MISSVLAMLLLAPSNNTIIQARKDYAQCLSAYMKQGAKDKMEAAAFSTGLATACGDKEQKLRTAIIAVDTAAGIKRAAAEQGAGDEIEGMRENIREMFLNETGAAPKT